MFLEYGVSDHAELVHVSQAPRGRVNLKCPYCGVPLLARKGQRIAHHFAHDGPTCNEARRDFESLAVPLVERFDRWGLNIKASTMKLLQRFAEGRYNRDDARTLNCLGLVRPKWSPRPWRPPAYELTQKGKIPFGLATLQAFATIQAELAYRRHQELQETVDRIASGVHLRSEQYVKQPKPELLASALVDLKIYRAQLRRYLGLSLYLLIIEHSSGTLYKVGVTSRPIEERIAEVERDLSGLFAVQKITLLRVLKARGMVEGYVLHRLREHRVHVGNHREYLKLDASARRRILSEYTRLGDAPIGQAADATWTLMAEITEDQVSEMSDTEFAE
jgi:hypothetical protein